jgi:exodeoxyribonuclease V beta subunit
MSFDICSRSELLPNRLFVEASAGTGKTFLIEHYIVRAALNGTFKPQRLALITFTKAVARELRLRLQRTLETTHSLIIEGNVDAAPEYLHPVLEQESFLRRKTARTIEETIDRLPEATISTIHGFCDHLLQLWGRASGSGTFSEWISADTQKQWLEEFLQEGGGLTVGEFESISKRYWFHQDKLTDILMHLMDDLPEGTDTAWEEARRAVDGVRSRIDATTIASALEAKARTCCSTMLKSGSLKPELQEAFAAIQRCVEEGVREQTLDPLFQFSLSDCFSKPLKRQVEISQDSEETAQVILLDLWPALQQLTDTKCILKRLGMRCATAFRAYLARCDGKTPETVVRKVLTLSTHEPFVALAAESIEWLIIDEFQDTDGVQYQIFSNLFLKNPSWNGQVLFVGDPKQAIYGFRKADVYSYLAAKQHLAAHEQRTLSVNYRADPSVVEAQNHLFAGPSHHHIFFLPQTQLSLNVTPSTPGKENHEPIGDARGAIHLAVCHGSLGRKRRWPHAELENEALFPWIADEMISLDHLGMPFARQAILVKDKYQAARIQSFLESRNIPTCAWKIDSVTESPIYQWLQKAFFLALCPNDQRRLSSLLLSMPTDLHLNLCQAMASDKRLDEWASCAMAWKGVQTAFLNGGIGSLARVLFTCRWNGKDTLEEWLKALPRGDEMLIDLEHLLELLTVLEQRLPRSLEAYYDALQELPRFFSDEPELLTRRTDPLDDGAPILTMHRSKGLEFDVVYALGGASRTPDPEETSPDEADAEKLRQLYVTVTRAKRRCYLPVLIEDDGRPIPRATASPTELLFASLLCSGGPSSDSRYAAMVSDRILECAHQLAQCSPTITLSDVRAEQRGYTRERKDKESQATVLHASIQSSTRIYESFSSHHTAEAASLPQKGSSKRPIGTSFHAAIAKLLFAPPSARSSPEAIRAWAGIDDPELVSLLYAAAHTQLPLTGQKICLEQIPRKDMRAECGFLDGTSDQKFLRGIVDLVFVWDHKVYIIDWKTHEGADQPLEKIVDQTYNLQGQMYREAVTRAFSDSYEYGGCFFVFVRHLPNGIVMR